jgi:hypothetical protein
VRTPGIGALVECEDSNLSRPYYAHPRALLLGYVRDGDVPARPHPRPATPVSYAYDAGIGVQGGILLRRTLVREVRGLTPALEPNHPHFPHVYTPVIAGLFPSERLSRVYL